MPFQRHISSIILTMSTSACFQADDGNDEIAATETTSATDSTSDSTTSNTTTEPETTQTSDSTSDSDSTTGSDAFVFASDPPESYARVDRMGMPATATALISSKDAFNAASLIDDANGAFLQELAQSVSTLHDILDDDLVALGLTPCDTITCTYVQTSLHVFPDTLKLDLTNPPGFPNGRRLSDPVIDLTLAVLFLDLEVHTVDTFADIPVNPPANDVTFSPVFPFLAAPH